MAKITYLKNNFTVGEISPLLFGRTDLEQYRSGARVLKNFVPLPYGGIIKRPGFKFVNEVKDSTKKTRLIPFQFSTEQSYILEFGEQYIRFYMNGGVILSSGSPYEISTPYLETELFDIQYAQTGDILYLAHKNHKPKQLKRFGHTNWSLTDYTPANDPFVIPAWSASTAYNLYDRVVPTTANGYYYKAVSSGTSGTSEPSWPTVIGNTVTDGGVTWRCEGTTPAEYPAAVAIFEQRLWFGGTKDEPQTLWASRSGDYDDMTTGTADDDALKYTIGSNEVNVIHWLSSGKTLMVGTSGGIFSVGADSATSPITPTNILVRKQSNIGASPVSPIRIDNNLYYLQRDKKILRQMVYSLELDSYETQDMNILSEHILAGKGKEAAYQLSPYSIIFVVDETGALLSFTRNPTHKISAWARHDTDGLFESVAVIQRTDGEFDELWSVVNRTIGGSTKRYIEYMQTYKPSTQEDGFYVDSGLTYSGSPVSTVSGLSHLEGKTVDICADGGRHPPRTVSGGQVSLDGSYSKVHVGLNYSSETELNMPDAGSMSGTAQSHFMKISDIWIKVYKTLGGKIGFGNVLDEIIYRIGQDTAGQPTTWYSGFKRIISQKGFDREVYPKIVHDIPLPMTLLEVVLHLETSG